MLRSSRSTSRRAHVRLLHIGSKPLSGSAAALGRWLSRGRPLAAQSPSKLAVTPRGPATFKFGVGAQSGPSPSPGLRVRVTVRLARTSHWQGRAREIRLRLGAPGY